jgi:hypothetical protein
MARFVRAMTLKRQRRVDVFAGITLRERSWLGKAMTLKGRVPSVNRFERLG